MAKETLSAGDQKHKIDENRIVVGGSCAGGYLAYLSAMHASPKPKGVFRVYSASGNLLVSLEPRLHKICRHIDVLAFEKSLNTSKRRQSPSLWVEIYSIHLNSRITFTPSPTDPLPLRLIYLLYSVHLLQIDDSRWLLYFCSSVPSLILSLGNMSQVSVGHCVRFWRMKARTLGTW